MDNDNEFSYSPNNNFKKVPQTKNGFGKAVLIPLVSGIIGASLVIGVCFGVPGIKQKLFNVNTAQEQSSTSSNNNSKQTSNNSSYDAKLISLSEYSETSVAVAEHARASVVGITVTYNVSSFAGSSKATASGSGVIISEDGYIVTNNHIINSESSSYYYQITEATGIMIHLYGDDEDEQYEAKVIGTDPTTDLAVLKIDAENLQAIEIGDSDNLRVGEFVMAIGNPLGLGSSVSGGIISALNRKVTDSDGNSYITIQTDAAINSGNSGGALLNSKGELIGINSLKLSGDGIEGIGFAMPITSSMNIVNQLLENGTVKRPYIGIYGSEVSETTSERYNVPVGVYVEDVEKDSPAEKAKLEKGDIITEVEGEKVTSASDITSIRNNYNIGDEITLKVYRENEYINVKITLEEEPEEKEEETTPTNKTTTKSYGYSFNPFDY